MFPKNTYLGFQYSANAANSSSSRPSFPRHQLFDNTLAETDLEICLGLSLMRVINSMLLESLVPDGSHMMLHSLVTYGAHMLLHSLISQDVQEVICHAGPSAGGLTYALAAY